jgi:thiamine phosphate synthase YjbQ (UPF0047 family)
MEAALNHIVPEAWNDEFFEHTMEVRHLPASLHSATLARLGVFALLVDARFSMTQGPDDMPAHVKSSLLGASVSIPLRKGHMQLGTWQVCSRTSRSVFWSHCGLTGLAE